MDDTPSPRGAGHLCIPVGAALSLLPFVPAGLALGMGLGVALLGGNPYAPLTRRATHPLLALAVVGLGAGMDLREVLTVGTQGALSTGVGLASCLLLGTWLARVLGVEQKTGLLISIGTAICGGSAIAAVVPVLRPREQEVSVALGTVFLLNAVALFLFPVVGHAVGLDAHRFGMWCALAIHDTSSVVGAALRYAPEALAVATPVKLARALWIVPLTLALGRGRETRGRTRMPWFILGFLAVAALVTWVPGLQPAGHLLAAGARRLLVLTLFLIGANLTREALRAVGARPLAQGVLLWACTASASLGALLLHLVG